MTLLLGYNGTCLSSIRQNRITRYSISIKISVVDADSSSKRKPDHIREIILKFGEHIF